MRAINLLSFQTSSCCTDERKHLDNCFIGMKCLDDASTFIFSFTSHLTPCAISLLSSFCLSLFFLSFPPPPPFPLSQTQNHTSDYPGWHSTAIADNSRASGNSAPISSSLGDHRHHCTPSPPVDHGCLPEESASPARCMIVHQSNFLDNVKNLLEFAETLQLIDSVSRTVVF